METKGKRSRRSAAPSENPKPREVVEPNPAMAPSRPDVVVQRVQSPVPATSAPRGELADFGSEALAAIDESRAAMARGFDALSEEIARLARCGIDTAARTAIEMLAVKTFSDALAVNAGFTRASFDDWLGGSAKLSEFGVKLAVESSHPFLAHLAKSWSFTPYLGD
jgi:hypothetical protein